MSYPPPGYPPVPHPIGRPGKRANEHAVGISALIGAAVWLAVDIFETQWVSGTAAYVAGKSTVPALLAAGLVAIIARSSNTRWPLWRYPALIVSIAFGVSLLSVLDDGASAASSTSERATTTAAGAGATESVSKERRAAAFPALVGPWIRDDSAPAKARLQQAKAQLQSRLDADGTTTDLALYGNDGQQVMVLVFTTQAGSRFDKDVSASPSQAVVDNLAGAGVTQRSMVDPGPLGGALGCGTSTTSDRLYICTWAELGMLGTITFIDPQLTPDVAAETTRDFRTGTEH